MLIKFMLGIAVVAFTSFCGRFLAKKYRQRKQFFRQLNEFNQRFLAEIAYYKRPIRQFIASYTYQGEFNDLLQDVLNNLEESGGLQDVFYHKNDYPFLKTDEKKGIEDYFSMLGKGDTDSQKGYFSTVKERLNTWDSEAEKQCKRYGDLYVKLGFLFGLLVLILII